MSFIHSRGRVSRLPDKGKRITDFLEKIEKELRFKNEITETAERFSELNIASTGKSVLTKLEWNGKLTTTDSSTVVDSDDDVEETDPLKIIAQSRAQTKIVKEIKPEPTLITESDLREINSFDKYSINDPHVSYVCNMEHLEHQTKFKPFFTTKTNVHDPETEKLRKKNYKWEVTAATPPLFQHTEAQVLSLHDSLELQIKQKEKLDVSLVMASFGVDGRSDALIPSFFSFNLQEIQKEKSDDRLLAKMKRVSVAQAHEDIFRNFRNVPDEVGGSSDDESVTDGLYNDRTLVESDEEVLDECDEPEKGGIVIG